MENKRMFLVVALCAGIFLLWQQIFVRPQVEQQAQIQNAVSQGTASDATTAAEPKRIEKKTPALYEEKVIELAAGGMKVSVATRGGVITDFQSTRGETVRAVDMNALIGGKRELEILSPSQEWMYLATVPFQVQSIDRSGDEARKLVLSYSDEKVAVTRTYVLNPSAHTVDQDTSFQFRNAYPNYLFVNIGTEKEVAKEYSENERREALYATDDGLSQWAIGDLDEVKEDATAGVWAGIASRYFLKAVVDNGSSMKPQFQARPGDVGKVSASLVYRVTSSNVTLPVRYYYGVKEIDALKKVGHKLDLAVDFGWFTVIAYPMLQALKWLHKIFGNFGIAIILLTIFIKMLLYPLTYKSMKGMKEMQRIQPQIKKLQEKHKDDRQKLNQETLKLMQANGYNPMSGCFPMLAQMPVFIALYNVLYGAFDLYRQPFFGWITDLAARDPYFVTPIVLTLLMYLQQKMTPTAAPMDPAQQKMMQLMPVIFGAMMAFLPAGLTLYMLVNSIMSILQQKFIMRSLDAKEQNAPVVVS